MPEKKRQPTRTPGVYKIVGRRRVQYEARYRANDPDTGERRQFSRTFDKLDEAEAFLDHQRQARRGGGHASPREARRTFADLADQWLAARPRKPRTLKGYRHILDSRLKHLCHRAVATITYADVQAVLVKMREDGCQAQTQRNVFNVLRGVLNEARDSGALTHNPADRLARKLPASQRHEVVALTAQQVAALAASLPDPHGLVVQFAAWSGLRAGEITGLRVRHLDPLRSRVRVEETVVQLAGGRDGLTTDTTKTTKSRRAVPIPRSLMAALMDHVQGAGLTPDEYLFGEDGGPRSHDYFYQQVFKPAVAALGLPEVRFHDLRHTYASLMRPHVDMFELSRRMGHSTYRLTVDTYSHLYDEENTEREAAIDAAFGASVRGL